jgi:hypothetical protein
MGSGVQTGVALLRRGVEEVVYNRGECVGMMWLR